MIYKISLISLALFSLFLLLAFGMKVYDNNRVHGMYLAVAESHHVILDKEMRLQHINAKTPRSQIEIGCLAKNIFFEAGGEPRLGKRAVAMVTMNRAKHRDFPNSVCGVVYQRTKRTCQYSWVCGVNKGSFDRKSFEESIEVAQQVYKNYGIMKDNTKGSLYFHAEYVNPSWADEKYRSVKIGKHLFYKRMAKKQPVNQLKKVVENERKTSKKNS